MEAHLDQEQELRRQTQDALETNERVLTGIRLGQAGAALREHDPKLALSLLESCPSLAVRLSA